MMQRIAATVMTLGVAIATVGLGPVARGAARVRRRAAGRAGTAAARREGGRHHHPGCRGQGGGAGRPGPGRDDDGHRDEGA